MNSNMTHNAAHDEEMSMDEILASIRRYVTGGETPSAPEKKTETSQIFEPSPSLHAAQNQQSSSYPYSAAYTPPSKVVTLTVDDMVSSKSSAILNESAMSQGSADEDLISNTAKFSAQKAFQKIDQIKEMNSGIKQTQQRGIDDFVGELLRPMMKHWLDKNLPEIVERIVEREIQKALNASENT